VIEVYFLNVELHSLHLNLLGSSGKTRNSIVPNTAGKTVLSGSLWAETLAMPEVALHLGHWIIFFSNVPDQVSPLAFGIRACFAGEMPKVPKAWGLAAPAR
jgi:hypothetical protein